MKMTLSFTLSLKRLLLFVLFSACCLPAFSFTAITSGKWSSPATWGGSLPGALVNLADIDIPTGITVTLDQDVVFSGASNALTVNGTLDRSSTHWLRIDQGTLAGNGAIDIERLIFNSLAAMSFTGTVSTNALIINGAPLSIAATVNVKDTFYLIANTMQLLNGGNFTMGNNSLVIMGHGMIDNSGGGIFNTVNSYDVAYIGTSQTTGLELNTPKLRQLFMWLDDTTQRLSLGNDVVVNNDLHLRSGKLVINGKTLTLKHDVWRLNGSLITSDATGNIIMNGDVSNTDGLAFTKGSVINNLVIDMKPYKLARLRSNLEINGYLKLLNGNFSVENSGILTMRDKSTITVDNGRLVMGGGSLSGSGTHELEYVGQADTMGPEVTCAGLFDMTINLGSDSSKLVLQNDISVGGKFDVQKGHLCLSGNDIRLNGTFAQKPGASMIGSLGSDMEMHLKSAAQDTLYLDAQNNVLRNLRIDLNDGSTLILGSDLRITSRLDLDKGKIDIGDHNLQIDPSASVKGFNSSSYIVTSGTGTLSMRVNPGSPYVIFPVGTASNYLPAGIQQASSGSAGNFTVRVVDGVLSKGTSGYNTALQHSIVNGTWLIGTGTGMTVNMNLKLGWKTSSELNGFNRANAYITHYTDKWDTYTMTAAQPGPNGTFELIRTGITSLDAFAVADNNSALPVDQVNAPDNGVLLFPNPASEFITVSIPDMKDGCIIELMDMTGKVLQVSSTLDHTAQFRVAGLGNGYYMVRITDGSAGSVHVKHFCKY